MRYHFLHIPIDTVSLAGAVEIIRNWLHTDTQRIVVTPNPEFVVRAQRDNVFRRALQHADLAPADGTGIVLALRLFGIKTPRVPGVDLFQVLLEKLDSQEDHARWFFLGGQPGVADKAAIIAREKFGAMVVGTASPSNNTYGETLECNLEILNTADHQSTIEKIIKSKATIIAVALGHSKQEKWLTSFLPACSNIRVGLGVGGTFDYLAGVVPRAPRVIRTIGLEWLWRLVQEPWRWPRIIIATIIFPLETLRWWVRMQLEYRPMVVGCIINRRNEVLLVERFDQPKHWQLPQGGREEGETPEQAVRREMQEELNIRELEVLGQSKPDVYQYRWKRVWKRGEDDPTGRRRAYGFKGQRATIFYLRYLGDDKDIIVDQHEHTNWRWVPLKNVLKTIHAIRRPLMTIALADLKIYGIE